MSNGGGVKALTAIRDVTLITVGGPGIVGLTDVLARSFAAMAAMRANVLLVSQSSSQNDICFVIPSADEKDAVEALRNAFAPEIGNKPSSTYRRVRKLPLLPWSARTCAGFRASPAARFPRWAARE